jgi:predicted nucleic acid-binding protein
MSFLLDTNVVSEWVKPLPNAGLTTWLVEVDEDQTFLSAVTVAELRYGIERLSVGKRRRRLENWLTNELLLRFEGRVLSIDAAVADACGRLVARSEKLGRPLGAMDALIAATAQLHQLTLVTRDTSHFAHVLASVLNPWT